MVGGGLQASPLAVEEAETQGAVCFLFLSPPCGLGAFSARPAQCTHPAHRRFPLGAPCQVKLPLLHLYWFRCRGCTPPASLAVALKILPPYKGRHSDHQLLSTLQGTEESEARGGGGRRVAVAYPQCSLAPSAASISALHDGHSLAQFLIFKKTFI